MSNYSDYEPTESGPQEGPTSEYYGEGEKEQMQQTEEDTVSSTAPLN